MKRSMTSWIRAIRV
ncbi:unnamed protein product [Acanthoscelides obtectus]|nr:unnamed protein product [Acanthoscelides obtectus]CAK1685198.1 hypothetical protein AOBTE_LOCUS35257 [Acanthoscelides obtectus]